MLYFNKDAKYPIVTSAMSIALRASRASIFLNVIITGYSSFTSSKKAFSKSFRVLILVVSRETSISGSSERSIEAKALFVLNSTSNFLFSKLNSARYSLIWDGEVISAGSLGSKKKCRVLRKINPLE